MVKYSYKAINAEGETMKGLQDAASVIDLEFRLKSGGLDLIQARVKENRSSFRTKKIPRPDLITFFFNLDQLFG